MINMAGIMASQTAMRQATITNTIIKNNSLEDETKKDSKNKTNQTNDWNYDMESCPLDTKVRLLSGDDCFLLPQQEYVGTITFNGRFKTRGKCYEGDADYFYRSKMIAWKPYN